MSLFLVLISLAFPVVTSVSWRYQDSFNSVQAPVGGNEVRSLANRNDDESTTTKETIKALQTTLKIVENNPSSGYKLSDFAYLNSLYLQSMPENRWKAMAYVDQDVTDITGDSHRIRYDSVIASSNGGLTSCELGNDGSFTGCNFNEIFICSALEDNIPTRGRPEKEIWHGFDYGPGSLYDDDGLFFGGGVQHGWHRTTIGPPFRVVSWKHVTTRNRHIKITLRYGDRDSSCRSRQKDGVQDDYVMEWAKDVNTDGTSMTSGRSSGGTITCIKIEKIDSSVTCDHTLYTHRGWTFSMDGVTPPSDAISLPARAYLLVDKMNAEGSRIGEKMDVAPTLGVCKRGYYKSTVQTSSGYDKDSCETLVDCQGENAEAKEYVTQCTDFQIMGNCNAKYSRYDDRTTCIDKEITRCQDTNIKSLKDDNTCTAAVEYCDSDNFFHMEYFIELFNANSCPIDTGCGCRPCPSIEKPADLSVATGTTLTESPHGCRGAYHGRRVCYPSIDNPPAPWEVTHYLHIVEPPDGALGSLPEPECIGCSQCLEGQHVTANCGQEFNEYIPGVGTEDVKCADCTLGNCIAGFFRSCRMRKPDNLLFTAQLGTCELCNCDSIDACSDVNKYYCNVDTATCNGASNISTGMECRSFEGVTCPTGTHRKDLTVDNFASLQHSTSSSIIASIICDECEHPGEYKKETGLTLCRAGLHWLGCEEGSTFNVLITCTPCFAPPSAGGLHVFVQTDTSTTECEWACQEHYYRDGDTCVSCITDESAPHCERGYFASLCSVGSTSIQCEPCNHVPGGYCGTFNRGIEGESEYAYQHACSGSGYVGDVESRNNNVNSCKSCAIEPVGDGKCNDIEYWSRCGGHAPTVALFNNIYYNTSFVFEEDPSMCKMCSRTANDDDTNPPSNSVWASGLDAGIGFCDFSCFSGFYQLQAHYADTGDGGLIPARCIRCDELADICECGDTACVGTTYSGCDVPGLVSIPTCYCKGGYKNSAPPYEPVKCTICEDYTYSLDAAEGCLTCPGGYMGRHESGSVDCIPCPVNTYRENPSTLNAQQMKTCEHCPAGTDGLHASLHCMGCSDDGGGNGLKANLKQWESFVWNFASKTPKTGIGLDGQAMFSHPYPTAPGAWMWWVGVIPTVCNVQGTNYTVQICNTPGNFYSIRWTLSIRQDGGFINGIEKLEPTFECGSCDGGLAYSGTFDYKAAFEWAY